MGAEVDDVAPSEVPHSLQNRPDPVTAAPHDGQAAARLAPHSLQNFPLTGLAPHEEHTPSTSTPRSWSRRPIDTQYGPRNPT